MLVSLIKALDYFSLKLKCLWQSLTLTKQVLFLGMILSFAIYSLLLSMSIVSIYFVSLIPGKIKKLCLCYILLELPLSQWRHL